MHLRVRYCTSKYSLLEPVVLSVSWEIADDQKELGGKVGHQHAIFGGLGSDAPQEEFLFHL